MIRNTVFKRLIPVLLILSTVCSPAHARRITDMTGRKVTVPDVITTVYGTSPPATYMVYAMDPGLVAGLNFPINPAKQAYLHPRMETLPVIGGWFGQGRVANLETLLAAKPDIILVWYWSDTAVNEKTEQALAPLAIPVVYIVLDTLADYPAAFDFLGTLLGRGERARKLGRYAETVLAAAGRARADIPDAERLSVYYAEEADGLSTECNTSVHARLIPLSGGRNVHRCTQRTRIGRQKVSMEQVLNYDPAVIVAHDAVFLDRLATAPSWRNVRAVRGGRVYRIPTMPFNWFDRPPSFMRLLGLQWMMHRLYPDRFPLDLRAETVKFYRLFLNVDLDADALGELLGP